MTAAMSLAKALWPLHGRKLRGGAVPAIESGEDTWRKATDSNAESSERLLNILIHHLGDEEDLIRQ